MSRVARYAVLGGVMDLTVYIVLSLAPLLSERWGAGSLALGVLPVTWGVVYSLTATWGGGISDRVSRTTLARVGLLLVMLVCVAFSFADQVWHLYLGMPLIAIGMSFFWPALQAAIADESRPETLARNLGWFNLCWGAGKGLGILVGGVLLGLLEERGFLVAAGVALVLLLVMPSVPRGGGRGTSLLMDDVPGPRRRSFRLAALVANFAAFGLGTTILVHYPEWNRELGRGGVSYGIVVGGIFLAQTAAFGVLMALRRWKYRSSPLLTLQVLSAVGAVLLATDLPVPALIPMALALGGGFGIAYFASIYYSLHSDVARGGRAGLHETILGTGNFLVPLLGGVAASLSGSLRAPYIFGAGVVLLCVLLQIVLLRQGARQVAQSSTTSPGPL